MECREQSDRILRLVLTMQTEESYCELQVQCGAILPNHRSVICDLDPDDKVDKRVNRIHHCLEDVPVSCFPVNINANQQKGKRTGSRNSARYVTRILVDSDGKVIQCSSTDQNTDQQEQLQGCAEVTVNTEFDSLSRLTRTNHHGSSIVHRSQVTLEPASETSQCDSGRPESSRYVIKDTRKPKCVRPGHTSSRAKVTSSATFESAALSCAGDQPKPLRHTSNAQVHPPYQGLVINCNDRIMAYTRCSVQVGGDRTCCARWKNLDGKKHRLPKALQDLPQRVSSSTQTAMISFSAPAQLGSASSEILNSYPVSPVAPQQGRSANQSESPPTDQELPTYEEISGTLLRSKNTGPPPDYHELFETVLPESVEVTHARLQGSRHLHRGQSARTLWKPQASRYRRKRCCFGRLNDRECWILVLANGVFILIFILAAIFSK